MVDTVRREVEGLKQSTLMAMSKKADFTLVEGLREQLQKKVDHDYLVTTASKIKSECQTLISTYQTEFNLLRKQKDDSLFDRLALLSTV